MKGKFTELLNKYIIDRNQLFYLKDFVISIIDDYSEAEKCIDQIMLVANNLSHEEGQAIATALKAKLIGKINPFEAIELNTEAEVIIKGVAHYKTLYNYLTIQINYQEFYSEIGDIVKLYAICLNNLEALRYLEEPYRSSYLAEVSVYYLRTLFLLELHNEAVEYYKVEVCDNDLFKGEDLLLVTKYVAKSYLELGNYEEAYKVLTKIEESGIDSKLYPLYEIYCKLFQVNLKRNKQDLALKYYYLMKQDLLDNNIGNNRFGMYCDLLYFQSNNENIKEHETAKKIIDGICESDFERIDSAVLLAVFKKYNDNESYLRTIRIVSDRRKIQLSLLKKIHNEDSVSSIKQRDYYLNFYHFLYSKMELINNFHIDIATTRSLVRIRKIAIKYFEEIFPVKSVEISYFIMDKVDQRILDKLGTSEKLVLQEAYDKEMIDDGIKSVFYQIIRTNDGRLVGLLTLKSEIATDFKSLGFEIMDYTVSYLQSYIDSVYYFEEIRLNTSIDYLTNLDNSISLKKQLASLDNSSNYTLAVVDIDYLKMINGNYSLAIGDEVLKAFAVELIKYFKGELVARFTKSDFVLLINKEVKDSFNILEFLHKCDLHYDNNGRRITIKFSCGMIGFRKENNFDNFLIKAEEALMKAKNAGRNRSEIYDGI